MCSLTEGGGGELKINTCTLICTHTILCIKYLDLCIHKSVLLVYIMIARTTSIVDMYCVHNHYNYIHV